MPDLLVPAAHLGEMRSRLSALESDARRWRNESTFLRETIQELETELAREGFSRIDGFGSDARNFSRQALRDITRQSFLFWLKNPLVRRGVDVISDYVWGQGINVNIEDDKVEETWNGFIDHPHNQDNLFGHQARVKRDQDLSVNGNVFFVLFTDPSTGQVQLSDLPFDEIDDRIDNPQDSSEPWFYRRKWTVNLPNFETGKVEQQKREALYPDINYRPLGAERPSTFGDLPIRWQTPMMHVSDGGASNMKFAVPITYPALAWARAYNVYLENWIKLVRSLARFAWDMQVKGGQSKIDTAQTALNTTITSTTGETNSPPVSGAVWIHGEGGQMTPISTRGATMSLEDGRRIMLMVAAALGLPETFFGDVSVGTLATGKTLDRPTELRMKRRQSLWQDVYEQLGGFAMEQSARAPMGVLRGLGAMQMDERTRQERFVWSDALDTTLEAKFPQILERDMESEVRAWSTAATANGLPIQAMDMETYAAGIFAALRVPDPQEKAKELFGNEDGPAPQVTTAEANVVDAIRQMKESLERSAGLVNGHA